MSIPISTPGTARRSGPGGSEGGGPGAHPGARPWVPGTPRGGGPRGAVVVPLRRGGPVAGYDAYRLSGSPNAVEGGARARPGVPAGRSRVGGPVLGAGRRLADGSGRSTSRPAAAPVPAVPLRLTRRGQLVVRVVAVLGVTVIVLAGALLARPALAGSQVESVEVAERVVLPGETLWQIAGEVAPDVDRRETVEQIMELNDLSGAAVASGQRLRVPRTDGSRGP